MKQKKRIAILTQPLATNYGGILQAYALQAVLKKLGNDVMTVDRTSFKVTDFIQKGLSLIKGIVEYITFKGKVIRKNPTTKEKGIIGQNTRRFIDKNILLTEPVDLSKESDLLDKYQFDAYIVGSDQVWRPKYSPCITNYYLDFLKDKTNVKRISYAASFGVDEWELSPKDTVVCAELAKKFDAISVREDTAVALCKEHLGVSSVPVLDPTMLLDSEDYIKLVEDDHTPKSKGSLMTYVLDKSPNKKAIIEKLVVELNLTPFAVNPLDYFYEVGKDGIDNCISPPVTEWIRGFIDAEFVVTDSFHGTVFSIIFNKPFIAIGNESRGLSRFLSLLRIFNLENRLIMKPEELTSQLVRENMDFPAINKIRADRKNEAIEFLTNALNN